MKTTMTIIALSTCAAACLAADPIAVEGRAPASALKLAPVGAVSKRYVTLNYGVPGSKVILHEYAMGQGKALNSFIDILSPNGKRLQHFQLQYADTRANGGKYTIRPLWIVPARQRVPGILFEGAEFHLMVVFARGFGAPGHQQIFLEHDENIRLQTNFDELDKRGYRMVRVDRSEPATQTKPTFMETTYYFWSGDKFTEKAR